MRPIQRRLGAALLFVVVVASPASAQPIKAAYTKRGAPIKLTNPKVAGNAAKATHIQLPVYMHSTCRLPIVAVKNAEAAQQTIFAVEIPMERRTVRVLTNDAPRPIGMCDLVEAIQEAGMYPVGIAPRTKSARLLMDAGVNLGLEKWSVDHTADMVSAVVDLGLDGLTFAGGPVNDLVLKFSNGRAAPTFSQRHALAEKLGWASSDVAKLIDQLFAPNL
ncbi:MAG: hypothetical protein H6707_21095 [Deltaproteobacteria bacterium]|nr:hypothetical protein [Deltaproteobacteria bacterium]